LAIFSLHDHHLVVSCFTLGLQRAEADENEGHCPLSETRRNKRERGGLSSPLSTASDPSQ